MAIPRLNEDKRTQFLPVMARYFSVHGYDGTTTAGIAEACGVRQNVLYRIWSDKEAMFVAVIRYIQDYTIQFWEDISRQKNETKAEAILRIQSRDHGVMGYYRVVYSGLLQESPSIRKAIREMYQGMHQYIERVVEAHRLERGQPNCRFDADVAAWGMMGLGAMVDVQRELQIKSQKARAAMLRDTSLHGFLD
ncbi:MAG: TetR/AcrR family transcriptional regulator [Fuerstia sp.]|nr:TetR/AcrR family transcriptional regulator [Fuerstiella sp.]